MRNRWANYRSDPIHHGMIIHESFHLCVVCFLFHFYFCSILHTHTHMPWRNQIVHLLCYAISIDWIYCASFLLYFFFIFKFDYSAQTHAIQIGVVIRIKFHLNTILWIEFIKINWRRFRRNRKPWVCFILKVGQILVSIMKKRGLTAINWFLQIISMPFRMSMVNTCL